MAEYSRAVDEQISRLLQLKGRVTPDMVAGFDDAEAAVFLARYVDVHSAEVSLVLDGRELTWAAQQPATQTQQAPALSPVDQVLGMERGTSLLDSAPSAGKVPAWLWILPLSFALPGGLIAWFIAKDTNRQVALALWWTGVVVTVVTIVAGIGMGGMLGPQLAAQTGMTSASTQWPASETGRPTFYYFGSSKSPQSVGMQPVIDVLSRQYAGKIDFVVYADISTDPEAAEYAKQQGVEQMPTMMIVTPAGTEKTRWIGEQAEPVLTGALDAAIE